MRNLAGQADALAQRRMWMNGLADVYRIGAQLDRQGHFANQVTRVCTDDTAADDARTAVW